MDEYLKAQAFAIGSIAERWELDRPFITLYDQFGYPVYIPSSAPKIGRTITVRRPPRFK